MKRQDPQQNSDAEFKLRLEVAGQQAFDIFISVDEEAKALDTTSSRKERQSRRKRYHVFLFFFFSFCGRDPRRQVSDEANLSRMQHVRWWLGLCANRLFCQKLTVITQLPVVVLDDNSCSAMHFGSGAGLGRHNFPRQCRNAGRHHQLSR